MFYEFRDGFYEIDAEEINKDVLTIGFVKSEDLPGLVNYFDLDNEILIASQKTNQFFRTEADVHSNYTFAKLRVINRSSQDVFLSLYIEKNFIMIIDITDENDSLTTTFFKEIGKYPIDRINEERMIYCFIGSLLSEGNTLSEEIRNELIEMEEIIAKGKADDKFNTDILDIKKKIAKYFNYYKQMQDIAEILEENDNEILNDDNLIYISNLTNKVTRLCNDMDGLNSVSFHIQDAYANFLDQKMNNTMKAFTLISTIFFPITIIVGWYGMNFKNMPELSWRYGYLYVALLSLVIILTLYIIGKKKKWL